MAEEQRIAAGGITHLSEISDVLVWDCDLLIPQAEYDRLTNHPRLAAGLRALWESSLTAPTLDPSLLGIFKDAGRYVCAMWAMHLHVSGGLSLQSLKVFCAESRLMSPGRARAVLLYMRYLGYIEPARQRSIPTVYVPTPRFMAAWTLHMRLALEAACAIEPTVRLVVERMDDPDVFACVVRTQGESLFNGARAHNLDTPLFRVFKNRHAGGMILANLMTIGLDGECPPDSFVMPATVDLRTRFKVSRVQIRRILAEAERQKLILSQPDGTYRLDPTFREQVRIDHAMQIRHLLLAAARATRQFPAK